jgi:hypothetical protein
MKKIILIIHLISIYNLGFSQISIPKVEYSINNKDTLVWIAPYKSLLLCHFKGKRECLLSIKTAFIFKIDTIQFSIVEKDENLEDINKSRVLLDSDYCSFIDLDYSNCYFYIFKKYKKNFFSKSHWEELATMILPPVRSGLSGRLNNPNVDITDKVYLQNIFSAYCIYTNGKEETHTFDEKHNKPTNLINKLPKE